MKRREFTPLYDKNGIKVRRSLREDIKHLKENLRQSDVDEVWASHHYKPEEALARCLEDSMMSLTIQNGQPIGMFGITPVSILSDKAVIWMLGTDGIDKIKTRFLLNNTKFIKMFHEWYPLLFNYVDVRNKKSIKWLKFLGAAIGKPEPYGIEGKPFQRFEFKKDE